MVHLSISFHCKCIPIILQLIKSNKLTKNSSHSSLWSWTRATRTLLQMNFFSIWPPIETFQSPFPLLALRPTSMWSSCSPSPWTCCWTLKTPPLPRPVQNPTNPTTMRASRPSTPSSPSTVPLCSRPFSRGTSKSRAWPMISRSFSSSMSSTSSRCR